jgi:signal transduction histidine kinase
VYAPRAPIFAEDDLDLVQVLADHAAMILESRLLIEAAARIQAREESARLKDDFLSSVAHDLKSPLTGILGQAQLIELRAKRQPDAPVDLDRLGRIIEEARRMSRLIVSLLDSARADDNRIIGPLEAADLREIARAVCERRTTDRHSCVLDASEPVPGAFDPMRIEQLMENLVENGAKYSPEGGPIHVGVWRDGEQAHVTVTDHGIGVPSTDLPYLFERFHRGTNVDDRRFAGVGLGLYICRRIVEQHGGSITASSGGPGKGTTIHVILPAQEAGQPEPVSGMWQTSGSEI